IFRHRLQPFHQDYFTEGKLFSYSAENARACQMLMDENAPAAPFVAGVLPEPEEDFKTVEVRHLVRFFRNPAEYFLRERLGLRLPGDEPMLEDSEVFSVGHLDAYGLKQEAVRGLLEQRNLIGWQRFQALGKVPLGAPGLAVCHGIKGEADRFVAR